ncbi:aspartyl protease [uncultured Nostoc sp.]|uniref:aspartyl protease n=1 Tax=uncultured Nostoc sp. TaxID=340711 RepID=UPI0026020DF1|nr:aspartyl protease [uncultured Nostoc sp.]
MILGLFGNDDELVFEIELIGADGLELTVDVILDTGFSGWLAIDEQDLQGLDWIYVQTRALRTARGEADFNIYAGQVRIDGETFYIPVYVGERVSEVLLGRQWLKTRRLVVDMPSRVLTLG